MATTKKYDLAVKVGEYTNRDGDTKGRYENIGMILAKDDGGEFLLIKRTFNPAGVPNPDNKDSILVSKFEAKDKDGTTKPVEKAKAVTQSQSAIDDEIPF